MPGVMLNNLYKNVLVKILQIERKTGAERVKKHTDFPIWVFRARERATLGSQKGPGCIATGALLQALLGFFKPICGLWNVLIIFKQLIVSSLKTLLKIAYFRPSGCLLEISHVRRPKNNKWFDKINRSLICRMGKVRRARHLSGR